MVKNIKDMLIIHFLIFITLTIFITPAHAYDGACTVFQSHSSGAGRAVLGAHEPSSFLSPPPQSVLVEWLWMPEASALSALFEVRRADGPAVAACRLPVRCDGGEGAHDAVLLTPSPSALLDVVAVCPGVDGAVVVAHSSWAWADGSRLACGTRRTLARFHRGAEPSIVRLHADANTDGGPPLFTSAVMSVSGGGALDFFRLCYTAAQLWVTHLPFAAAAAVVMTDATPRRLVSLSYFAQWSVGVAVLEVDGGALPPVLQIYHLGGERPGTVLLLEADGDSVELDAGLARLACGAPVQRVTFAAVSALETADEGEEGSLTVAVEALLWTAARWSGPCGTQQLRVQVSIGGTYRLRALDPSAFALVHAHPPPSLVASRGQQRPPLWRVAWCRRTGPQRRLPYQIAVLVGTAAWIFTFFFLMRSVLERLEVFYCLFD